MAATPKTGNITFRGLRTGRMYGVNIYVSDVANANVLFSANGAAGSGSLNYWQAPEPVIVHDMALLTGTADTTGLQLTSGGAVIPSSSVLYTSILNTLSERSPPRIAFNQGSMVGALQF